MPTWKALFDRVPLHEASFDFVLRLSAFKENAFVCDGARENDFRWFLFLPRQITNAAPRWEALPVQGETLSANAKPLSDSVVWQDVAFDLHLKRLAFKKKTLNGRVPHALPLVLKLTALETPYLQPRLDRGSTASERPDPASWHGPPTHE